MSAPRILIVDDDKVVRTVLERQLTTRGCDVVCAETCSEAIHVAQEQKLDLLVIDVRLDADPLETIRDGFVLVGWLRRMLPDPSFRVIIHTKDRSPEVDARAEAEGNTEVFRKGDGVHGVQNLVDLVQRTLEDPRQTPN